MGSMKVLSRYSLSLSLSLSYSLCTWFSPRLTRLVCSSVKFIVPCIEWSLVRVYPLLLFTRLCHLSNTTETLHWSLFVFEALSCVIDYSCSTCTLLVSSIFFSPPCTLLPINTIARSLLCIFACSPSLVNVLVFPRNEATFSLSFHSLPQKQMLSNDRPKLHLTLDTSSSCSLSPSFFVFFASPTHLSPLRQLNIDDRICLAPSLKCETFLSLSLSLSLSCFLSSFQIQITSRVYSLCESLFHSTAWCCPVQLKIHQSSFTTFFSAFA